MSSVNYVVLYAEKKPEDNIIINNMFENNVKISIGWTDMDCDSNFKQIERLLCKEEYQQIIFSGFEVGWDRLIIAIKEKYRDIKIKVISNTNDSLLYYEYERNNFFKLLELSKKGLVDNIAFFRKGQYEVYKNAGYECSYIKENYILDENKYLSSQKNSTNIEVGMYQLNYTWDKNIFNQLCVTKFIDNSNLNYNSLDIRMDEFLNTMKINHTSDKIKKVDEDNIIENVIKNDVIIAASFTEYVHPIFFISMELGIPCLIGNNSDFFEDGEELGKYVVTSAEDNPIVNAKKIKDILENKDKIIKLYGDWKKIYNQDATKFMMEFLDK